VRGGHPTLASPSPDQTGAVSLGLVPRELASVKSCNKYYKEVKDGTKAESAKASRARTGAA
jgi:hypothetical protein